MLMRVMLYNLFVFPPHIWCPHSAFCLVIYVVALLLCHIGVQHTFNGINSIKARCKVAKNLAKDTAVNFKLRKHLQPVKLFRLKEDYFDVKLSHK